MKYKNREERFKKVVQKITHIIKEQKHTNRYTVYEGIIKRRCSKCNTYLDLHHFYFCDKANDGLQGYCYICHNSYCKKYNNRR